MNDFAAHGPVFALVDDHVHSARLMRRVLDVVADNVALTWLGDARRARRSLCGLDTREAGSAPDLIVVDLKSHSAATGEFVAELRNHAKAAGVALVAIAKTHDDGEHDRLRRLGADAVFIRHPDLDAYKGQIEAMTSTLR